MRLWSYVLWALLTFVPLSANAEQLPGPVEATANDVILPPSRAVVAATIARLSDPPATEQRISLTCAVWMPRGVWKSPVGSRQICICPVGMQR
jgi:hypothetical protein